MTRAIRVLELRSVRGTGGGPEKTILLGSARTDARRFAVSVCYLRDKRDPIFSIDKKASDLPVDYIELTESHSFDVSIFAQLRQLVRERDIDIVHAHDYKTDVLAWLLSKAEGITPMSTAHGWTGHSWRERALYYPLDKRVLARFPRVVAVSSDVRRELVRNGAHEQAVTTVLNGIDHTEFRRDRPRERAIRQELGFVEDDFVIGAVGRVEPQKRFDLLLEAVASLRAKYPRVRVMIAGTGSRFGELRDQTSHLRLDDVCRLLGNRTDIADLHHAFDVFVQSSDYEGTPNAVLEAMALESPVIATSAGGTAEIVRNGIDGLIVPTGNSPAIVDAIASVLRDPDAARARAASARRRVETDLSFEARMNAVEAIYVELFKARSGAKTSRLATART
jgi:glycosyltransferase involved in cell wall biosynthesis